MKISIITVTLNSEKTIRDTINSILSQDYKNLEHIIVDGGSKDKTLSILDKYKSKKVKIYKKKNFGIYKSINFGIKKSKGKFILILNSDDIFHSNKTISKAYKKLKDSKNIDIFLGNVAYFSHNDYFNINRFYSSKRFKIWKMKFGLMPPHPASFISRRSYNKFGTYNENFKIAADFELFLRFLYLKKLNFKILDQTVVRMRTGGISGKNLFSYWISTKEIIKSFKINNIENYFFNIILRIPAKINQLLFFNRKKINDQFKIFKLILYKDYYLNNSFKIVKKISSSLIKKNFILSGMNLAFLGYYANKEILISKTLFHWPDGIWVKNHFNTEKIPGRELIKNMQTFGYINKIYVLGKLSNNSKKFLEKKFKIEIIHKDLPFGSINEISKRRIWLPKNSLTFITLPTPKQEKLANILSKYNKNYKIVCIGASIAIASGDEKQVPNILKNYEFFWRLRTDFFRRSKRILETLIYYFKGKYIDNMFKNLRFIKFD